MTFDLLIHLRQIIIVIDLDHFVLVCCVSSPKSKKGIVSCCSFTDTSLLLFDYLLTLMVEIIAKHALLTF